MPIKQDIFKDYGRVLTDQEVFNALPLTAEGFDELIEYMKTDEFKRKNEYDVIKKSMCHTYDRYAKQHKDKYHENLSSELLYYNDFKNNVIEIIDFVKEFGIEL